MGNYQVDRQAEIFSNPIVQEVAASAPVHCPLQVSDGGCRAAVQGHCSAAALQGWLLAPGSWPGAHEAKDNKSAVAGGGGDWADCADNCSTAASHLQSPGCRPSVARDENTDSSSRSSLQSHCAESPFSIIIYVSSFTQLCVP